MSVTLDEIDETVLEAIRERADGEITYLKSREIADDTGISKAPVGRAIARINQRGIEDDDLEIEKWSDGSSSATTWMVTRHE